jgi:hypothetical protein
MATIRTYPFQNSTILRINSEFDIINTNPVYQRKGEVWTVQKKQLLIDSILNDYDIPKLYFHFYNSAQKAEVNGRFDYAIIDGRQRIEAIWGFINGDFPIGDDFEYLADLSVNAKGLTYSDLASEYPKIKVRFDSYLLPIILVETEDIDLIEDMFSRLNEAVPLNAAEKRNAKGGPMAAAIRNLAEHQFFTQKVRFNNNRYQHREVAARLLFLEYILSTTGKLADTKKPFLDKMVDEYKESGNDPMPIYNQSMDVLDQMANVFGNNDELLRSQSTVTVYYLTFKKAMELNSIANVTRRGIIDFYESIAENRRLAEKDITQSNYELLEFERMSQQGTNDAYSIKERTRLLCEYLGIK